jgi:diacylglycerol kinase (ATP)
MPQADAPISPQEDGIPPEQDRVVISVNPKSGARSSMDRVQRLAELLRLRNLRPEILSDLDEATQRATSYHRQGCLRALVGCGGDGTVAELVNRTEPGMPITMLPAGNENLLAKYLNLGHSPENVCRTIVERNLLRLDAGNAGGRIFLLMVGCGFDAEVVRRLHQGRTGHVRKLTYAKPIFETIRSYKYPEMRVYCDDEQTPSIRARWLFAFNLPCYARGLPLAPAADGSDGLLDVCAFGGGSFWHGLRYVTAVIRSRHERLADCTVRRVRRLRITSEEEVPYQLDGDPGGTLPVDIEMLPGRLTVIVPPGPR